MKKDFTIVFATAALSLVLSPPVSAQRVRSPTLPTWLPRATTQHKSDPVLRADEAIIEANLAVTEGLVARISGYANPRGFEVRPWWSYSGAESRVRLREYELSIAVFVPSRKASPDGDGGTGFHFNPPVSAFSESQPVHEENGGKLYIERARSAPVLGSTITYGVFDVDNTGGLRVLFTAGNESPTLPVTREEYLRALIFEAEGKDQEKVKATRAAFTKTPYEQWIEGAAERKKTREVILSNIADKAQAEKTRAQLEADERKTTEAMKKDEANARAWMSHFQTAPPPANPLRAQLAAMTPAERASPAYIIDLFEFVAAGTPNAHAIVRENPAFYRARRSPVEPRAILVILPNQDPIVRDAHRQLYREFDWATLKGLLDQRP